MKRSRSYLLVTIGFLSQMALGCSSVVQPDTFSWIDGASRPSVESATLSIRWAYSLVPDFSGGYLPVENAAVALDMDEGRLFTGSSTGTLWALTLDAKPIYRYVTGSPIEASPTLDTARGQLYVGTIVGELHALNAKDGSLRWKAEASSPISQQPLLSKDAVYLVTDSDIVISYERSTGEVLWRYRREPKEGFLIAGHAGIVQSGNHLITGFSDGAVVALDMSDGHLLWERDTSLDIEEVGTNALQFVDVDTTPVLVGDLVYVASYSAGLYGLSVSTGAVKLHRPELKAVSAIAGNHQYLVLSSAEAGIVCMDIDTHDVRWQYETRRGSPGQPMIKGQTVYVGESGGAFMALSLQNGKEISRIEFGHGFSAPAAMARGRGYIISNGGTLLAFNY